MRPEVSAYREMCVEKCVDSVTDVYVCVDV